jgi:hypothetical protein
LEERRKNKRLPIKLHLEVNSLFKQDHTIIQDFHADIDIVNISKTGIGFITKADFPLEYYFNAKIEFEKKEFFYTVIKIIRKEKVNEGNLFGCEFIGLAEFLANKIDVYEEHLN